MEANSLITYAGRLPSKGSPWAHRTHLEVHVTRKLVRCGCHCRTGRLALQLLQEGEGLSARLLFTKQVQRLGLRQCDLGSRDQGGR